MQYQPQLWYLQCGVPSQKRLMMPDTTTISPYSPSNNVSLVCQLFPNQQQNSNNTSAITKRHTTPATSTYYYSYPVFHSDTVGTLASENATVYTLSGTPMIQSQQRLIPPISLNMPNSYGHSSPHLQTFQLQNERTELPKTSICITKTTMFSPIKSRYSIRASSAANNLLAGMHNLTSPSNCVQMIPQDHVDTRTIQLTCAPSSLSLQGHYNFNHSHDHCQTLPAAINLMRHNVNTNLSKSSKTLLQSSDKEISKISEKRKVDDCDQLKDLKRAKLETKALKAKRPGFTDERYQETSYYIENGLRKVYPYYFTFTTFTKGRWVGEKILDVFAREFRAHPTEEYERCIKSGTLTVNYEKVPIDYKLKHNDLLANIVHRHEVPVTSNPIGIIHMDDDIVVVNKPASIPVHPCGRYRHNTVVFILAKEYNLKHLRTIHRLDRLTSGLLLFGRSSRKARQMENQIRNRQVEKEYICRVEGNFPEGIIECSEPIEVVSYKIGVCKVSRTGKDCTTTFQKLSFNGKTSVVLCKPLTGRMHQIRVHLQYLGFPVVNDPLYNHQVFGPCKGRGGNIGGKTDEELIRDLISIHNAENWLGFDGHSDMLETSGRESDTDALSLDRDMESSNTLNEENYDEVLQVEESFQTDIVGHTSTTEVDGKVEYNSRVKVAVGTQTDQDPPDMEFNAEKMTTDKYCYECKVRYRDPKPTDLVMYLHAWRYKGPGWEYETPLPCWGNADWIQTD